MLNDRCLQCWNRGAPRFIVSSRVSDFLLESTLDCLARSIIGMSEQAANRESDAFARSSLQDFDWLGLPELTFAMALFVIRWTAGDLVFHSSCWMLAKLSRISTGLGDGSRT